MKNPYGIFGAWVAALALMLDQLTKWLVLEWLHIAERPPIEVTPFFNLVMVWNHGISFGLLAEHNQPLPLIALALGIIAVMGVWLVRAEARHLAAGIGMVIGGALGNVIDRVRFGAVADFFDFHLAGLHWPAFNIADSCIFIGVVVLCLDSMLSAKKNNDTQG